MLTVGSCFSGIGGLELGLERTGGFETKWQIENDEYASRVLAKHWPNVKRYSDIRNVVQLERVDLICGGFPCQDVSLAGARKGLEGKRSTLWGEMFRLICEIKPRWVVAENVPGLLSSDNGRFFGNILRDLADAGYDAEWRMLSARSVGSPQLRERIFIIANNRSERKQGIIKKEVSKVYSFSWCKDVRSVEDLRNRPDLPPSLFRGTRDGIPCWMDRLKCLGNSVVPQVAQRIGEMILEQELIKP